jgi:hypothetical protein
MSDEETPKEPLSRRDFLRRASREAVETGTRIVPGAALAKTVLGVGETTPEAGDGSGVPAAPATKPVPGWLRKLAAWRGRQQSGPEDAA